MFTHWRSLNMGSSPLARGLLGWLDSTRQVARIIPARAGFTGDVDHFRVGR